HRVVQLAGHPVALLQHGQLATHPIGHDPEEILARLPERYRARFLADYREAMVAAAHETWRWQQLADTLNSWHLRSLAYSAPGYERARTEAGRGENTTAAEHVIPGWAERVAQRGGHG
ncbi:DUF6247 family protein, partial [Nonomuraea sp. NPDC049695]|uniref:DUF6247 family protein n=1 Tax=Nonomuraea sp. NPDC049695 TaxID=3154734 RepID=UPI0034160E24